MYAPETDRDIAVELHVRSELPSPAEAQAEQVYERLAVLSGQGAIDGLERTTWPNRTPTGSPEGDLRDTYLRFQEWAERNGHSLSPFFQTRECYTPDCDGWADWLVTPALCLAVYEGDSVTAIYPHADGQKTRTVQDGLDALERALSESTDQSAVSAD
jgi:hypothetical protein